MIRVKKVVGESFDLETGKGSSKGLLLVNDNGDTILVEVGDDTVQAVIGMMAAEQPPSRRAHTPPAATSSVEADLLNDVYQGFEGTDEESHYESYPASDDDYDPGEQYGDPSSGLPSV